MKPNQTRTGEWSVTGSTGWGANEQRTFPPSMSAFNKLWAMLPEIRGQPEVLINSKLISKNA